jgi:hypothetical protein
MRKRVTVHIAAFLFATFFVIAGGAQAAGPLEGYTPAELALNGHTWRIRNFSSNLKWNTFKKAFDLRAKDYFNPGTYLAFASGKRLGSTGNCFGMVAAIADVVDQGRDRQPTLPYIGRVRLPIYAGYPSRDRDLRKAINTLHWRQMSASFVRSWLRGRGESPERTFERIKEDLAANKLGLLAIAEGTSGHVILPIATSDASGRRGGNITVYDPNHPFPKERPGIGAAGREIEIKDGRWSYRWMDWDVGSSRYLGWEGGRHTISYIPYDDLASGWRRSPASVETLVTLVFGSNSVVEQVSDQQGRKLYTTGSDGQKVIDTSSTGLSESVYEMINFSSGLQKGVLAAADSMSVADGYDPGFAEMEAKYGSRVGDNPVVFFVPKGDIADLSFDLKNSHANGNVDAFIFDSDHFYDVSFQAVEGTQVQPKITLKNVRDLSRGLNIHERNGMATKVAVQHARLSQANGDRFPIEEKTFLVDRNVTLLQASRGQLNLKQLGQSSMNPVGVPAAQSLRGSVLSVDRPEGDPKRFEVPMGVALALSSDMSACTEAIQGKVAYDYKGNNRWAENNLAKLCDGAENSKEPARCFERVMHGGVSWGGGTQWQWNNALNLCRGTTDASRRVECFEQKIRQGTKWQAAIDACSGV